MITELKSKKNATAKSALFLFKLGLCISGQHRLENSVAVKESFFV